MRRSNPECARGGSLDCLAALAMTSKRLPRTQPRVLAALLTRGMLHLDTLFCQRAQGRPGAGWAPAVHCAKACAYKKLHSGIQVEPETTRPSLRSGLTAYAELSPGSDALLPPSPCGWLMRAPGRTKRITARLDAQAPGVRTTRFCRTPVAPVVCAKASLTVSRPAIASSRRCCQRPPRPIPRFVTIAIRPSDWG
ncbi:hypothetical protein SAMN05216338_10422 [Bradyrhizobium sp. Rc2d]|nr:hypothetical protein SAMN05216338_10422 [Bradyrhizobium sp. Rc2d]